MRRFRHKLYFKVALVIALSATVVGAISSYIFFLDEIKRHQNESREYIKQLSRTVEKTASIAIYVHDAELAAEIVEGVAINDVVAQAQLNDRSGFTIYTGMNSLAEAEGLITLNLYHPFSETDLIGSLDILPNQAFINQNAKEAAVNQAQFLALLIILTALFVSFTVHKTLTSPLNKITSRFEEVRPGEDMQLSIPRFHQKDEIGSLARGINSLVKSLNLSIESERALREHTQVLEKKFRLIFEQASAGICLIDNDNILVTANPAFDKIIYKSRAINDAIGLKLTDWFYNKAQLERFLTEIRESHHFDTVALDLKMKTLSGSDDCWVHCLFSKVIDSENRTNMMIEVLMYDVTERTEREINTRFEADHDALTHLKNRRAGMRALTELFERAEENNKIAVIINIDLDRFKQINDVYGHEAGDAVLIEVGRRMMKVFRNDDLCIRWGGDEFVVGCYFDSNHFTQRSLPAIEKLASELRLAMSESIAISMKSSIEVGGSIGIAFYPQHGDNLEAVLAAADTAMYNSKELGRNRYSIFEKEE